LCDADGLLHKQWQKWGDLDNKDALASEGIDDRVDVEFLRPATLQKLIDRLDNDELPAIDILHFDGHGVFDADGNLHDKAKQTLPPRFAGLKQDTAQVAGEEPFGDRSPVENYLI
jgi:hypothetical protein